VDDREENIDVAWCKFVDLCVRVYGAVPVEDGTVGQAVQMSQDRPWVFRGLLNLYGKRRRDVWARIDSVLNNLGK